MSFLWILTLMTWQAVSGEDKSCIQCATPSLKDNWAVTGLPKKPDSLKFHKECAAPTASLLDDKTWLSSNCASSCFEILVPVDRVYAYVRGCHENFVWDEMKVTVSNGSVVCEVNQVPDYGSVEFLTNEATEHSSAYAGTIFCQPTSENSKCNNKITDSTLSKDGSVSDVSTCTTGTAHSCKSCSEYDGSGSCSASTSGTCKGVYCTKTVGKMNDHSYEARGCSSFNPFAKEVCSWNKQTFNVSTGADRISLSYQANQCFCQGELCNSAPQLSTLLLSFSTLLFLAST